MFQARHYRNRIRSEGLVAFRTIVKETDLDIRASLLLETEARESVLRHRGYLESYIRAFPEFARSLTPWRIQGPSPEIIRALAEAGHLAGVGPMAAVAGAIAERVGRDLLRYADEVIVENGGDIFLKVDQPVIVGIFAGRSPLNDKIGLRLGNHEEPLCVCTSSGSVGHSLSFGKADAVCVVSMSGALADAAATAIGNQVRSKADIQPAIDFGSGISGVEGLVIIFGDKVGFWGDLEIVPLADKRRRKSG